MHNWLTICQQTEIVGCQKDRHIWVKGKVLVHKAIQTFHNWIIVHQRDGRDIYLDRGVGVLMSPSSYIMLYIVPLHNEANSNIYYPHTIRYTL